MSINSKKQLRSHDISNKENLITQVQQQNNSNPKNSVKNGSQKQTHSMTQEEIESIIKRGNHAQAQHKEWLKHNLLNYKSLIPPLKERKKTLVLDLDETLVHSTFQPAPQVDIVIPVQIDDRVSPVYVAIRPGVKEFLQELAPFYELVIFTASLPKQAEPLIDKMDPQGLIAHRLFRDACTNFNGAFVKDMRAMGRSLSEIIIVDNSPICQCLQPENAVPIKSWFDDQTDTELFGLKEFLKNLDSFSDVRTVLGVVAKDPTASKQQTTSAKVLNGILKETKLRTSTATPDREADTTKTDTINKNSSNGTPLLQKRQPKYNSSVNIQENSSNVSKHKIIDCDNLSKEPRVPYSANLKEVQSNGRKTGTPLNSKSGLKFFRNPQSTQVLGLKPTVNSIDKKSGSVDSRPIQKEIGKSPLLKQSSSSSGINDAKKTNQSQAQSGKSSFSTLLNNPQGMRKSGSSSSFVESKQQQAKKSQSSSQLSDQRAKQEKSELLRSKNMIYKRNVYNPNLKLSFKDNVVNTDSRPATGDKLMNIAGRGVQSDKSRDPLMMLKKTNSDLSVKMNKVSSFGLQKESDKNKIGIILKKTHSRSLVCKI